MVKEKLGQRIKELRNSKGISQEKFSLSIDMDRSKSRKRARNGSATVFRTKSTKERLSGSSIW